jgi:tryptophan-rich sensory protein
MSFSGYGVESQPLSFSIPPPPETTVFQNEPIVTDLQIQTSELPIQLEQLEQLEGGIVDDSYSYQNQNQDKLILINTTETTQTNQVNEMKGGQSKSIFSSFNFTSPSMFQKCTKAPWQPPNIVFPFVWTFLYTLYFIILIQTWNLPSSRGSLIIGLALNFSWIFAFKYNSKLGLLVLALMIGVAYDTSRRLELDGKHTLNNWFQTYIAWLLFAFSLNFYISVNCNN